MKAAIIILAVTMVLVGVSAYATPPTYEGQFGNPEEPALRIIKWPWLGFRKLVVRTHEGLQSGLEKESLSSTGYEGTCGAWDGSKTFVEHTASGLVYAPLPGKASLRKSDTYEKQVMSFIEVVTKPVCEEQASAAVCCPKAVGSDDECVPEKKEEKYLNCEFEESDVEKAQRRYVPRRAAARDRVWRGGGNLLKLAR